MPVNARDLRRRIRSVKNTQQITKAMEMVAVAKLRRAQEQVRQARPYARKIQEVVTSIAQSTGPRHSMMQSRPVKTTGYVIITSDRGLAGAYNIQVIRHALREFAQKSRDEYVLFVIGRKGRDYFARRNYSIAEEATGVSDTPSYSEVQRIAEMIVKMYMAGIYDELYLVYNEFKSALTQIPTARKILPLDGLVNPSTTAATGAPSANYDYEPTTEKVLDELLPRYAETLIYQALLEAKASEFGMRMRAMGQAKDNAGIVVKKLTLSLNRARQAAITTQIAEIVGGSEALK